MTRRWLLLAGAALTVVALGSAACRPQPDGAVGDGDGTGIANGRVQVETLTPEREMLQRATTQPATVHAWMEARVFAKVSGYLSELHVDLGSPVKAGDVLAVIAVPELEKQQAAKQAAVEKLEAEQRRAAAQLVVATAGLTAQQANVEGARAEVAKAAATLTASGVELERVTQLVEQRAVADRLLDEATKRHEAAQAERQAALAAVASAQAELELCRAQVESARADQEVCQATTEVARRELEELDEQLQYAQLKAPFDGVVTRRHVDQGDLVRNAQTVPNKDGPPLFVVTQLDKVRLRVAVPERDAPLADPGDSALVTLQALPGEELRGQVSRIAGSLDETTRTMLIEIDLPNPEGRLLPGMFGQATIHLEPPRERLTLPANAVRFDEQGKSYVYVVDADGEVAVVDVRTGLDDGQQIEIVAGLLGSERVAGPSLKRLRAGQRVDIK